MSDKMLESESGSQRIKTKAIRTQLRKSSRKGISKTEICKVCNKEVVTQSHFGAVSCFSCKAFFKRVTRNGSFNGFICRKGSNCEITKISLKQCQKCWFDKCIQIGMKPNSMFSKDERMGKNQPGGSPTQTSFTSVKSHPIYKDLESEESLQMDRSQEDSNPAGVSTLNHVNQLNVQPELKYDSDHSLRNQTDCAQDTHRDVSAIYSQGLKRPMKQANPLDISMRDISILHNFPGIIVDELSQIQSISQLHDANYKSISFGEELIKEMVMSSAFKVPLSQSATMTAYRLMVQRVTRVAQGLDSFINLPHKTQNMLLKNNADLIVSLRGAVFFEKRKGGLDQILISMGVDDLFAAMETVSTAVKTKSLQRIDYSTFNTLQKVGNNESEQRYNQLLERVGVTVSFDMDLVKILTYILLFSVNIDESDSHDWKTVQHIRDEMIGMMERYISAKYPKETFPKLLPEVFKCIADLQELTLIKKQRQLALQTKPKTVSHQLVPKNTAFQLIKFE